MDYRQSIDYISTYTNYEVAPRVPHNVANYDLRRVFELLERLGNPHLKAKSVHITGSNGKGSVAAMIASVLKTSYTTGLYISPHLHTWRERIQVDNQLITESEFASLLEQIKPEIEAVNLKATYGRLTTFEILTVLAFAYFAYKNCAFQVLEVGLGGRYDATSVIKPEVAVLTPISLEHIDVLGDTLTKIAGEKAAIIKPGSVCVSGPQTVEAMRVIEQVCNDINVKLIKVGEDVTAEAVSFNLKGQSLRVKGRVDNYELFIPLLGEHQISNAAVAVATLEVLVEKGYEITSDSIAAGMAAVNWPGRLQVIGQNPLMIVDGAHNPGAARILKNALQQYFSFDKAILVIGVSGDKNISGIAAELAPVFHQVIATKANHPRATHPEKVAAAFRLYGIEPRITGTIAEATALAKSLAGKKDFICVAGSLFVVAECLQNELNIVKD